MKHLISYLLFLNLFLSTSLHAGVIGGGGSPPAIVLPKNQFTEMTLGILRGEDILIRSEGIDKKFQTTAIDSINGTITVSSPDDGATVILQDFEKKFGKKSGVLTLMQKSKSPTFTIPENPDVTTIPTDTPVGEGDSE